MEITGVSEKYCEQTHHNVDISNDVDNKHFLNYLFCWTITCSYAYSSTLYLSYYLLNAASLLPSTKQIIIVIKMERSFIMYSRLLSIYVKEGDLGVISILKL